MYLIEFLIVLVYGIIFLAAVVGIIYFIFIRNKEKKSERDILDRDDY